MKCYIIGAGASFGQNTQKPEVLRPPRSDEFFVRGNDYGILKQSLFPKLYENVHRWVDDKGSLYFDIESFLGDLESKSQKDPEYSQALGESYFYIYELLRYCSAFYFPVLEKDNYYRLSNQIMSEGNVVISLNYDTLLEKAVQSRGGEITYNSFKPQRNVVPVCKVHGSINWLNRIPATAVAFDEFDQFTRQVHNIVFSGNTVLGEPTGLRIMLDNELNNTYYVDLVEETPETYEPVIIPPVAEAKNYRKVFEYDDVWDNAGRMISQSDEIVIIGSSIRKEDSRLRKIISQSVTDGSRITLAVGSNSEKVIDSLNKIVKNPDYECYTYFDDYVEDIHE